MSTTPFYKLYKGDGVQQTTPHPEAAEFAPEPYIAGDPIVTAVQLAIFLNRPLLLEGDPGCGKTRLAYSVAYELGIPLERWNVTSGSRAKDGLYSYDAVRRLHDVQLARLHTEKQESDPSFAQVKKRNPSNPSDYLEYGPIGRAFNRKDTRTLVLIDEIDKADVDFANDLLNVIDRESRIQVEETGDYLRPEDGFEPIYIVTSNREKGSLPDPFLRRCVYKHISFPDAIHLRAIVTSHWQNEDRTPPALLDDAITRLEQIRSLSSIQKKPGTSELIDWLRAVEGFTDSEEGLARIAQDLRTGDLPFPETLIKVAADLKTAVPPPPKKA